ncbi:MAG: NAD-dependent epimerase/dehydratase family protein [Vicinamibacterales bacterium]|jgi:UDP-glucose 4-epimerase
MAIVKLANARVLITGGAGLIGSHIADRLVQEQVAEVVVLDNFVRGQRDNLARASASGRVTIVDGDIRDRALVRRVMDGIDVVFHQAALRITQCAADPALAIDVLINGTDTVVRAAIDARVRKVVAASSASVYGMADRFPTTEQHHPYNNRTLYGAAKAFNEALLRSCHDQNGLDYVALRYFNVYGPRMDIHGVYTEVLIRWMEKIATGQPLTIFGDGLQTMDFIYVDDVARANILAATAPVTDRVYNVGTGTEVSLKEMAEVLQIAMGASVPIEYAPPRAVNPVPRRLADTWLARQEIGFEAAVSFEDGMRALVAWWQQVRRESKVLA